MKLYHQLIYSIKIYQLMYLQLFDGLSSLANDEASLASWDHHLVHRAVLPVGRLVIRGRGCTPPS